MSEAVTLYELPPFFTLQPVPATLQQQLKMWAQLLLLQAEAAYFIHMVSKGAAVGDDVIPWCSTFDAHSPIFRSSTLNPQRKLSGEGVSMVFQYMLEAHSGRVIVSSPSGAPENQCIHVFAIPIQEALEQTLVRWLHDQGQLLSEGGSVCTIDELLEERTLDVKQALRTNSTSLLAGDGRVSGEKLLSLVSPSFASAEPLLRALLNHLATTQASAAASRSNGVGLKVVLFNLDGSDTLPYQGVKFTTG